MVEVETRRRARSTSIARRAQGVPRHEDVPEVYPGTGERMEDFLRQAAKGPVGEGSSKRKEGGTYPAAAPGGKRLRQQKVTDARTQHMLERAHRAGFLLNPRRRHVEYFSGEVRDYPRWLVRQAKRYILMQTGYEEDGVENIIACRQFEDFHMQQGTFGDWGGGEGRACGRACSGDKETIECASWWSQYGSGAPELQRCALRVMHMWSCASPTERNWGVHEGIHTKKRNQLAFEKVVQLVEITANVRLSEYRRAGCGYVLPWQRDEGMLDCQAGLELEPVRTGTRKGMTPEEIAHQVALITRDPIGVSAPPAAEAVFGRRASIFRPYPREDDSNEEPVPEAADDPALRIPREIDETHLDREEDTRAHTTRRDVDRAEREMMGGEEELWGPFGKVASTGGTGARVTSPAPMRQESSMPPPSAPSPAPPSPVAPYEPTTAAKDTKELASSLPQRGLLHRGGAEEGGPSAAAVEGEMAVEGGLADTTIAGVVDQITVAAAASLLEEMAASVLAEEAPAPGGADAVEGQAGVAGGAAGGVAGGAAGGAPALDGLVAAAAGAAGGADAVEGGTPGAVEEEIGAQAEVSRGGSDERLMQQFLTDQYDPVMAGMTPGVARGLGMSDSQMRSHLDLDLSMGPPPSCGGATSTDHAPSRDDAAGESLTQPQRVTTTGSPDAARDILERERARLMASTNPRAQAFARALEDARRRKTGGDCVEGGVTGVVAGEDVVEGVADEAGRGGVRGGVVAGEDVVERVVARADAEAVQGGREATDVHVEGLQQAVDEAVQAGRR
ncbi:hypothetical protein CBR_g52647 [Chara braunii]|uniref:HAT C-terminal dimerisation domain-containing protein n=1 Tax=Chara braunii TaxID=69332 RepID=A0A388MAT5_CHABU|nr:hypothetical protein CBR_g52647 [Chara braunii]|eukprot:GBG91613.1 hypothetical protein CBR_g52647 [Chara braunii]